MLSGFLGVAVALQDLPGEVGHGGVPASFLNDKVAIPATVHVGIKVIVREEGGQGHGTVEDLHLRVLGAEEESGGIQRLGIKVREDGVYQLFQAGILLGVGYRVDGEEHMELRSRRFAVFHLHVVAAVMDRKGDSGKGVSDVGRILPILRVLTVVVVAVHRQAVAADEIVVIPVAALILSADIILADGLREGWLVGNIDRMRIQAVSRLSDAVRMVNREHQSYTSFA